MSRVELANETIRVVIDPQNGCTIDALDIRSPSGVWTPVIWSTKDDGGSFLMLPWTNRIKDGKFSYEGGSYTLATNHSDGTAIHGIGRDQDWGILDRSPYSARFVLDARLLDRVNWPFPFGAIFRVEIGEDWIELDLDITNLGEEPMPCGVGHHPYFNRTLWDDADELQVQAGVQGRYPCKLQIPVGAMVDDAVSNGIREGGPIGNPDLDDVFGGFDGNATLVWNKSGVRCEIRCSDAFGHLVVYAPRSGDSGPPLPYVCVEPVTMVNDAFNSDNPKSGLRVLNHNETLRTKLRMTFDQNS